MAERYIATTTIRHGIVDGEGKRKRIVFTPGAIVPKATVGASFEQLLETGALRVEGAPVSAVEKDADHKE